MPSEHAILSASDADRWINCPPSVRLTQDIEDEATDYADEGTVAHSLAELLLRSEYFGIDTDEELEYDELTSHPLYNKAMLDYVNEFVSVVHEHYAEAANAYDEASDQFKKYLWKLGIKGPQIFFEAKVDTSDYIPEGFGTSDVVIVGGNRMFIIDLKYGKGKPVSAVDNPQLKAYALGALKTFKKLTDFVTDVTMTIVQPRLYDRTSSRIRSTSLLKWGKAVLRPAAEKAYNGAGDMSAGKWCQWCPIKNVCRQRAKTLMAGVELDSKVTMSPSEIARIVDKGSEIKQWIDKVEQQALKLALSGVEVDGYKLVQGKAGKRTVRDPEALAIDLTFGGYSEDEILKPQQVKGITDLEKVLGLDAFQEYVTPYLTQKEGQPKLAPVSDKRPEWKPFDAASAFDDFEEDEWN